MTACTKHMVVALRSLMQSSIFFRVSWNNFSFWDLNTALSGKETTGMHQSGENIHFSQNLTTIFPFALFPFAICFSFPSLSLSEPFHLTSVICSAPWCSCPFYLQLTKWHVAALLSCHLLPTCGKEMHVLIMDMCTVTNKWQASAPYIHTYVHVSWLDATVLMWGQTPFHLHKSGSQFDNLCRFQTFCWNWLRLSFKKRTCSLLFCQKLGDN